MYALVNMQLTPLARSELIHNHIKNHLGNSNITADKALVDKEMLTFKHLVISAAQYPPGLTVIYFQLTENEISVYIYGKTIHQIKNHCNKVFNQLKDCKDIKLNLTSASILIPINGLDTDILTGIKKSRFKIFTEELTEKFISKIISAILNSIIAIFIFSPTGTPAINAIIGLSATAVAVILEAIHSAFQTDPWDWKESK